jgi:hypothetical protein
MIHYFLLQTKSNPSKEFSDAGIEGSDRQAEADSDTGIEGSDGQAEADSDTGIEGSDGQAEADSDAGIEGSDGQAEADRGIKTQQLHFYPTFIYKLHIICVKGYW